MCNSDIIEWVGYDEFDKYRIYVEKYPSKWYRGKANDGSNRNSRVLKEMFSPEWEVSDIILKIKLELWQRSMKRGQNELKTFFE